MDTALVDVPAVARRWGVKAMTVYRLVESGRLRAVRIGRALRFRLTDIEAYEARHTTTVESDSKHSVAG